MGSPSLRAQHIPRDVPPRRGTSHTHHGARGAPISSWELAQPRKAAVIFPNPLPRPLSKVLGGKKKKSFHSSNQSIFISPGKTPATFIYCLLEGVYKILAEVCLNPEALRKQRDIYQTRSREQEQRSKYWQLGEHHCSEQRQEPSEVSTKADSISDTIFF